MLLRREYREQRSTRDMWVRKTDRVTRITSRLADSYKDHAHDLTFSRYGELKKMAKAAIRDYKVISVEQQVANKTNARATRASAADKDDTTLDELPPGQWPHDLDPWPCTTVFNANRNLVATN